MRGYRVMPTVEVHIDFNPDGVTTEQIRRLQQVGREAYSKVKIIMDNGRI